MVRQLQPAELDIPAQVGDNRIDQFFFIDSLSIRSLSKHRGICTGSDSPENTGTSGDTHSPTPMAIKPHSCRTIRAKSNRPVDS